MSMQDNIRELEQVTEGLKNELTHKEGVFKILKKENEELEIKLNNKTREDQQAVSAAMLILKLIMLKMELILITYLC